MSRHGGLWRGIMGASASQATTEGPFFSLFSASLLSPDSIRIPPPKSIGFETLKVVKSMGKMHRTAAA